MNVPAIILRSQFKVFNAKATHKNAKNYGGLLQYIDRSEAKATKKMQSLKDYWSGESTLKYLGNTLKTNNVFNQQSMNLSTSQIEQLIHIFNQAQLSESPLWQKVFSFDNNFLKQMGYLTTDNVLNDLPLKHATIKAVERFKHDMKFNHTAEWVAAIHYNTDNVHIHVAIVERETSRPLIAKGKYKGQRQAKPSKRVLKNMKSIFTNSLIDRSNELARATYIARHKIREPFKELQLHKEIHIKEKLSQLIELLPTQTNLWKYNMHATKQAQPLIDDITHTIVQQYFPNELEELKSLYHDEVKIQHYLYGNSKNNYYETKLKELNASLGNALLTQIKQELPDLRKFLQHKQEIIHTTNHINQSSEKDSKYEKITLNLSSNNRTSTNDIELNFITENTDIPDRINEKRSITTKPLVQNNQEHTNPITIPSGRELTADDWTLSQENSEKQILKSEISQNKSSNFISLLTMKDNTFNSSLSSVATEKNFFSQRRILFSDRFLRQLKYALKQNTQDYLAQRKHRQLQYEIEHHH